MICESKISKRRSERRVVKLDLSTNSLNCINKYINLVEQQAFETQFKTILCNNLGPCDDYRFAKYRNIMQQSFEIYKTGGSHNPKIQFVIIRPFNCNGKVKLYKYPHCRKLMFPDGSIYEGFDSGKYKFIIYNDLEVNYLAQSLETLFINQSELELNNDFIRLNPDSSRDNSSYNSPVFSLSSGNNTNLTSPDIQELSDLQEK